jgi:RHS repeat-associated core domain
MMKGIGGRLVKLLWLLPVALPLHAAAETVEYFHTDALGTPIAVTDASGNLIETSEYEPYGKLLNRPLTDGPGFTGHVQDATTGLTYMQQRYYDQSIGRFLSVDPVGTDSNAGTGFNRYVYSSNNPYKFIDPDGQADVVFFQRDEGLAVTARRFGIPNWFTVMGHAGRIPSDPGFKFRDDRSSSRPFTGERLTVNRLVEEVQRAGFDSSKYNGVFLGQCRAGQVASEIAAKLGSPIMASEGYVFTRPNNTSGDITYKSFSAESPDGKAAGRQMTFNVYGADGKISAAYSEITMKADGSVIGRQANPEIGTRIIKWDKIK